MDQQDFSYEPLEPRHIRVLEVELGRSPSELVSCKCTHLSLDDPSRPPYVAISYTWGSESQKPHKILINGRLLSITQNVYEIFRSKRMTESNIALWIDAICINQDEKGEKSLQVTIMGEIYSRADHVRAWLGPSGESSGLAISFTKTLHSILPELKTMDANVIAHYDHIYPEGAPEWVSLANLLSRPWFTRAWVVQEIVLSAYTEFICGNDVVSWDTMAQVVIGFNTLGFGGRITTKITNVGEGNVVEISVPGNRRISKLEIVRQSRCQGEPIPLLSLMLLFFDAETTNPLDKVYGFHGIATDVDNPIFTPDYTETNSPRKLFVSISKFMITQDKRLNLLRWGGISEEKVIPSWTFNFVNSSYRKRLGNYPVTNAEGQVIAFSSDDNELTLRGIIIDSITELGDAATSIQSEHTTSDGEQTDIYVWYLQAKTLFQSTTLGQDEEAFWRTLLANRVDCDKNLSEDIETPPDQEYGQLLRDFEKNLAQRSVVKERDEEIRLIICPEGVRASKFANLMIKRTQSRRFCILREGSVGLVPTRSRPGDLVVAFLGAMVLFVIRPVPNVPATANKYHLIGECYVHDRMDGQVLELGLEAQDIVLV